MDTMSTLRISSPFHPCNAFKSGCQSAFLQTISPELSTLLDVLQLVCWTFLAKSTLPCGSQKPQNWRLSCQTNIGDGEDCGDVTIKTKPK